MSRKRSTFGRIVALYGLLEEMHLGVLRQAAGSVQEAEAAIALQSGRGSEAANQAREALVDGNQQQWIFAGAQQELSGLWGRELETVRVERKIAAEQARCEYMASRMKSEQVRTIVDRHKAADEHTAGRRTQADADDRFLSRLRWMSSEAKM